MSAVKLIGIFIFTCLVNFVQADTEQYRVSRSNYMFSTIFDMASDTQSVGSVIKSKLHLTTHYDAYDAYGAYEGQGICRLFCLGLMYTWGTEIDIYDDNENKIGMIDGQLVSSEPAKFSVYDAAGNRIAIAYLDQNRMGFNFIDPNYPTFTIARLTRNFILGTVDNWDVVNYYPETLSPILMKVFAAFACDTQNKFKRDL